MAFEGELGEIHDLIYQGRDLSPVLLQEGSGTIRSDHK